MKKIISDFGELILREERYIFAYALILVLGFSIFSTTISFVPANGDDLILLSSVAKISSPLKFFVGDWGLDNNAYRPLHSLSIWLIYHFFGVTASYKQLFNLVLHLAIICLLFRFISRIQPNIIVSLLLTLISLVSMSTISPVTWVSDRPTLFVALFLFLLLNYLYKYEQPFKVNIPYIVILSILALMSKESGLIVPIFTLYFALQSTLPQKNT